MKTVLSVFVANLLSLGIMVAAGETDSLSSLRAALRADLATQGQPGGPPAPPAQHFQTEQMVLNQLERITTEEDSSRVEQLLKELLGSDTPPAIRTEVTAALKQIQLARVEQAKAFVDRVTASLKNAREVLLKAKTTRELDPVLSELRQFDSQRRNSYSNPNREEAISRLTEGTRFVKEWQDYLFAMETGKIGAAMSTMKNLAERDPNVFDIPRSDLLFRLQSIETAEKNEIRNATDPIFKSIRTLDDVPGALAKLRENSSYHSPELNTKISALETLSKSYTAYKNGLATSLPGWSGSADVDPVLTRLRAELLLTVLPRILGTEGKSMPNNGETVEQYLKRITDAALAAKDYDLLGRVILARRDVSLGMAGSVDGRSMQEFSAFTAFQEGQNDERAQRFTEAVVAYMRTLRSGTSVVPAEVVGERLAAIEREHPEEYRRGAEMMRRGDGAEFRGRPEPPHEFKVPGNPTPPAMPPRAPGPALTPSVAPARPS